MVNMLDVWFFPFGHLLVVFDRLDPFIVVFLDLVADVLDHDVIELFGLFGVECHP